MNRDQIAVSFEESAASQLLKLAPLPRPLAMRCSQRFGEAKDRHAGQVHHEPIEPIGASFGVLNSPYSRHPDGAKRVQPNVDQRAALNPQRLKPNWGTYLAGRRRRL